MKSLSTVETHILKRKIEQFLEEDIRYGDITSTLLENLEVSAKILSKSNGIVCGIQEARIMCDICGVQILFSLNDGDNIQKGLEIMHLSGKLHDLLIMERTLLNIMMRMSSIATTTNEYVKLINQSKNTVKIAATRKTTPGFRLFEKRAVLVGGKGYSDTHRWSLDDMVLIKDTHIAASNRTIPDLVAFAKSQTSFSKKIEIEVQTAKIAILAARSGVDILMFDNMKPSIIKSTIQKIVTELGNQRIPIFEASGNITLENVSEYIESGVDVISTSQITFHPEKSIDISLEIMD
ncbi:MAG: carboxylating nicotinate-nucleotide diphosphorylase [Candidatus Lokiarchaeota archaeon]|nr:carboxylating nicotinate-nucleotide diphosphorylase [Candidatus Lokiarchaeota archaeon]